GSLLRLESGLLAQENAAGPNRPPSFCSLGFRGTIRKDLSHELARYRDKVPIPSRPTRHRWPELATNVCGRGRLLNACSPSSPIDRKEKLIEGRQRKQGGESLRD